MAMATVRFSNKADMVKAFSKDMKAGNMGKSLINAGGDSYDEVTGRNLESAAVMLRSIIQKNLHNYFTHNISASAAGWGDYQGRTGKLIDSVSVEMLSHDKARVYFGEGAWRDSLWYGGSQRGYLPELLNDGWHVTSGWHMDIKDFGYFDGIGFIDDAIEEARNDPMFQGIEIIPALNSPFGG